MPPKHLETLKKDRRLWTIIEKSPEAYSTLKKKRNYCLHLCRAIIGQQISTQAAEQIYRRFLALFASEGPTAKTIRSLSLETLRDAGLSYQKASYVLHIATFFESEKRLVKSLNTKSNREIIELLTQIKGVGVWTVEMFLMFTLGREDVFPDGDLGIQVAMNSLYPSLRKTEHTKLLRERMRGISESWSPYQSYACLYLWKWKDSIKRK